MIALLLACTDPGGDRLDPWPPSPIELDIERSRVHIRTGPAGLRDLVAESTTPIERYAWTVDRAPTELTGAVVPARRLYPGEVWRVEATFENGDHDVAAYEVPEPLGGNVLVLLLDDVGVDKVGAYGWDSAGRTPRLDGLADAGVRFTRAYASPVCSPTRGTLMTGRMPRRTGLGWIADTGTRDIFLPYESTIIPEMLEEARGADAWSDSAIGKWHMAGPQAPDWLMHPLDSGFSWFAGAPGNPQYQPDRGYFAWTKNVNGTLEESVTYMTTDSIDDALARIEVLPEPWFVYVAFNAVHTPLALPPADLVSQPLPTDPIPTSELYDLVLEALDTEIGRLLDTVDPDVLARTTVMAIGDNGTSDHGVPNDVDLGRNKHTPYEGGIRVPFIVTGPHVREPGRTSDALVHVADVLPTVADLAGIPLSGDGEASTAAFQGSVLELSDPVVLDGRSLLPHLLAPGAPGRDWVYAEGVGNGPPPYTIDRRAVQTHTHKLVRWNGRDELYVLEGADLWDSTEADVTALEGADLDALETLTAILDAAPETWAYEGF
ncbi:MAG: sulfatase-like hydrolase/transferase [Myxococcota bacterium]